MKDKEKEILMFDYQLDNYPHVNYLIKVEYSEEDELYLAKTDSFKSLISHGETPDEALESMKYLLSVVHFDIENPPLSEFRTYGDVRPSGERISDMVDNMIVLHYED